MLLNKTLYTFSLNICESGRIPESFSKRVAVNFQLGYQLVLVGSDSCKHCLWKYKCPEFFRFQVKQGSSMILLFDDMHPRLIFVHWIQYYLEERRRESTVRVTFGQQIISSHLSLTATSEEDKEGMPDKWLISGETMDQLGLGHSPGLASNLCQLPQINSNPLGSVRGRMPKVFKIGGAKNRHVSPI